MKLPFRILASVAFGLLSMTSIAAAADSLAGRWDATVTISGTAIPFRLDVSGEGSTLAGTLFNGDEPQPTTRATHTNGQLVLSLDHYLATIVASEEDGALVGTIQMRGAPATGHPFRAVRHVESARRVEAPNIAGNWIIPHDSPKGEKVWRFIVKQSGADLQAAILRVDGDTGALTGTYADGVFVISHFDGSRPALMHVAVEADGSLTIQQKGVRDGHLRAYRPEVARAKGLPEPADYATHTTVRDPNEVFAFAFPDITGKVRTNNEPAFKNKVLVVTVTGTWCPNCHDEAQYLSPLYTKYRNQGLEIVALDFEEPEQRDELARVKAFVKRYGVEYTYLIAGAPAEMLEKVPQAVNLNTWPATFFVGRDGRVRGVHAGFAAPASGEFNEHLQNEYVTTIERLLAEPAPAPSGPPINGR